MTAARALRRARASVIAVALAALWPRVARARPPVEAFLADRAYDRALTATVAVDPALGFGLGYAHALEVGRDAASRRLGVHVDVSSILGFSSWDLAAGVSVLALQQVGFDVLCTFDLRLEVAQNDVHTAVAYGYGAAARPGWYGADWYLALDLALRGSFAVSLVHRDAYRALYPDVRDGTYASDHLNLFAGVALGVDIGDRVVIGARFAWRFARTFETYAPYFTPYTVDLDVGVRF